MEKLKEELRAVYKRHKKRKNLDEPKALVASEESALAAVEQAQKGGFTNRPRVCYNCGKEGHMARDCKAPKKPKVEVENCFDAETA